MEGEIDKTLGQKAGWLRKRGGRVHLWGERYFVLRGPTLFYYLKASDTEPKGVLHLNGNCKLSEIGSDVGKKKKQFVFRIVWPVELEDIEEDGDKKKSKKKAVEKDDKGATLTGGKVAAATVGGVVVGAMTAGLGLVAGMVVVGMGAAAGGGAVAFNQPVGDKEKSVILACDSYHDAEQWVQAIEEQLMALRSSGSTPLTIQGHPQAKTYAPPANIKLTDVEDWIRSSHWQVFSVSDGVRIFEHVVPDEASSSSPPPPCLRVNVGVNGSTSDVFMTIMNLPPACRTGAVRSIRIVEAIDNCTDIVHIVLEQMFAYPTWTAPRDFCLMRYWKQNSDGSYVVCLDSTVHLDCPLMQGHVRGDMHSAYIISPPKDGEDEDHSECLLTYIAQMDPKGWVWKSFGFQQSLLRQMMLHVLDIRDYLDSDRFVQVHFDPAVEERKGSAIAPETSAQGTMGTIPPSILAPEVWSDIDGTTFRVRGATYMVDKVKAASPPCLFKLIAVDMFEVDEPTQNISAHPRNRVAMALQRGEKSWVFVLNIMVPGPPFLSFVAYMQGDPALIEEDTPFGRVAKKFFHGNDDEFRNNRFKLIPKVIDGNMIIKMAVKDTPTLLGNKLKQYYHKGENYFEIDVDVGSSSIARNVVGLAIGYSKAIVVDMGMCLQGDEENELPEVLMGGCTCIRVDCAKAKKL